MRRAPVRGTLDLEALARPLHVALGEASSMWAAIFFAFSLTLRETMAVAAPQTGVERLRVGPEPEGRIVRVALAHLDVLRGDAELSGHDLGERRLVALPLGLDPELEDGFARRVQPELGGVEHLYARRCGTSCQGRRPRSP